jgi:Ca2+-binding RTX toxin-like protein
VFNGNGGNDTMTVGSGDTMTGGGGNDTFVFNAALTSAATITDFSHESDVLQMQASGFGQGLAAGGAAPLATAADIASSSHAGTGGYFIFDSASTNIGTLYWDATGGSGADAVALVHLANVTSLTALDFHLV